jgi:hypothetical protein
MSDGIKRKEFTGFSVALRTDSRRKQRLSNYLNIEIETDRSVTSQRLTIREARALQRWLNDNLDTQNDSTESV